MVVVAPPHHGHLQLLLGVLFELLLGPDQLGGHAQGDRPPLLPLKRPNVGRPILGTTHKAAAVVGKLQAVHLVRMSLEFSNPFWS
uniref:Putative secreted protein n=1 Tax=Ixodes ricinus TaxID=34613 RepID=A0A6B0U406_IXORI